MDAPGDATHGYLLPAHAYWAAEWFEREQHLLFSDTWHLAAAESQLAGPGDFVFVPPYLPHQELNATADQPVEAVVVRSGQEPIVVNLDIPTPEEAAAEREPDPFHSGPAKS